jgi:hypothetical protein
MPRKLVYSEAYLNSERGKQSARLYSPAHRAKLVETWRVAPPERRARWNEIVEENNSRRRAVVNERTHKVCSTCKALKALECFPKNRTSADGYASVCIECRREYDRVRYATKGHSIRARVKKYRNENLPKVNALDVKKNKSRKRATPKWLSWFHLAQIEEFYELAAACTMQTGVEHNVDHIVPIKGKKVSGLHVPWNLQVLTAKENASKAARFIQE